MQLYLDYVGIAQKIGERMHRSSERLGSKWTQKRNSGRGGIGHTVLGKTQSVVYWGYRMRLSVWVHSLRCTARGYESMRGNILLLDKGDSHETSRMRGRARQNVRS